jgi:hydroxymethylbilane synthase
VAQANEVAEALAQAIGHLGIERHVELVRIATTGDHRHDVPLHTMGGLGVFVKQVQQAVLDGRADVAVHSAKDLPTTAVPGLRLAAIGTRRTANDALVGAACHDLARGATVATGSVRRRSQLHQRRPDLVTVELRGNIHTRLSKVPRINGVQGAIVMAVAALEILQLTEHIAEILPTDEFVPSPGQGSVALECRSDDAPTAVLLEAIDHAPSRAAVDAERAFLAELGSGCSLPVGAYCVDDELFAYMGGEQSTDVAQRATTSLHGSAAQRRAGAAALAQAMLHRAR